MLLPQLPERIDRNEQHPLGSRRGIPECRMSDPKKARWLTRVTPGTLLIAAADQLRLRWNPFHSYLVDRTAEFMLTPGVPEIHSGR